MDKQCGEIRSAAGHSCACAVEAYMSEADTAKALLGEHMKEVLIETVGGASPGLLLNTTSPARPPYLLILEGHIRRILTVHLSIKGHSQHTSRNFA